MGGIRIEIEGLEELKRAFREAPGMARGEMSISMERATQRIQVAAQARAPVDTSRLKQSITYRTAITGDRVEGRVGSKVFYAPYMEYGTGTQTDGTGGKGGRHWPPADKLNTWARRHGFKGGGRSVAFRIGIRGGLKPRRYLRGAFQENLEWVQQEFERALDRIAQRMRG